MLHIPRISNLHFFNEATLAIDEIVGEVEQKIIAKTNKQAYEIFCKNKYWKPIFDLYALFSPFNEANKAFYPFISYLKRTLKKGDIILDVGNRNGWSAALLAGLFPEQKIISIWEGDTDVMGYGGYSYWFDDASSNIEIYFCNLNEPLPFEDKAVAFVYGLDVLHRQARTNLVNELIRVVKDEALIVFPHVHMANAEPAPYFKRGGDLVHGLAYEKLFSTLKDRKGYVFSEPDLFRASYDKSYKAKANANTTDYNGLVAIGPKAFDLEKELAIFNYFEHFGLESGYLLPNEILEVDVNNCIKVRAGQLEAEIEKLLSHRPVYIERIKNTRGYTLTDEERIILYWARKCRSCSYIQKQLNITSEKLKETIEKLQDKDILQIMPLHEKHVRMQHYFAHQEFIEPPENFNLRQLWNKTVASFPNITYALDRNDNAFYTYKEFDEIVKYITSTLLQNDIGKGDRVLLHGYTNFETIGLFWACMQLGIVFIPVSPILPEPVIAGLMEKYRPKIIFLAHDSTSYKKWRDKIVYFDNETEPESKSPTEKLYFSEWLKERCEIENLPSIDENDLCIIMQTSGSTGIPKGVKLTHGQIWQGAINAVGPYVINEKNTCLSISGMDSIGGFRNVCFITIAGGTCIIPTLAERNNPAELLTCIYETKTHCMSVSPSLLNQLLSKKDAKARLAKMQAIMSVGSALTTQLKTEFFEKLNKRIFNVYGMTEAAGVLICEPLNSTNLKGSVIGNPVDIIIKVVDEDNNRVKFGEIGELLLYGYTVFKGYYTDNEPNPNEVQSWYATGDLVRMNPDGSIELTGRKKDFMKNARGEIVYFSEIEEALAPLPFIKDLGVTAFFSNESERGAIFVVLHDNLPTPKNLVEEIKNQITTSIGSNKIPSVIKVIDKIPRTKYGKLLKAELNQYI